MDNFNIDVGKLRNLKQYKGLSDEEIIKRVTSRKNEERDLEIEALFISKKEKTLARNLLHRYLEDYSIETVSDKNTLQQLIYLEILHLRLQVQINEFYKDKQPIKDKLIDSVHKNINEISLLKDRLGISKSKLMDSQSDAYKALDMLKKKFKLWRESNQGSRTIVCPNCSKMVLLKIRTDKYDAQKHPFFKDRILYNEHLLKLLSQDKITKDDVAKILETSSYYVDWLLSKFPPIKSTVKDKNQIEFLFEENKK